MWFDCTLTSAQFEAEIAKPDLGLCGKCDGVKYEDGILICPKIGGYHDDQ